jgi:hypothetical protein
MYIKSQVETLHSAVYYAMENYFRKTVQYLSLSWGIILSDS